MKHLLLPDSPLFSFGKAPHLKTLPRQFRLSVWNLHKCSHVRWEQDFATLCSQSDLFLVQEMRLRPQALQVFEQSGLHWNAAVSFLSPYKKWPTGIACGCTAPAADICFNRSICEPLFCIPKMTMRLLYPLADTSLLVINLHAINFTGLTPFKRTLQNAEKLLETFQGPIIIAGDFNVWNAKRKHELQTMAKKLKLEEVLFFPDGRTRYFHRPVDYIFIRGLQIVSSKVLPLVSSDHRPLTAVLRLP